MSQESARLDRRTLIKKIRISRSPACYYVLEYMSPLGSTWNVLERTDDLAALELIRAQVLMGVHPDLNYVGNS